MELHKSCQMISFDVKLLFTNVPLNDTIDIFLRRICIDKEINTNMTKKELKELILLCTKDVHFAYNNLVYKTKRRCSNDISLRNNFSRNIFGQT